MKKKSDKKTSTTKSAVKEPAKTWAMACHLASLSGFLIPLANVVVPLILWLMKKDEYPFVDDQGKESVNFQISMLIYYLIAALLIIVIIGLFILPLLALFNIISVIIASAESYEGKKFRYIGSIRFIK